MAEKSRTLKLSILADVADLVKNLKTADTNVQSFGDKAAEFGKKAALAFAVAGAAVAAFAVASIKAAAEDEAAQKTLAATIQATTGATALQVKGVEDYITKTSIAVGVADDQLRPAFGRLVKSTQSVDEAQRLLNLALDLSVASGKPLETVSNALGKAYDGNTLALGKLGLGLDETTLKSGDLGTIIGTLETTFGEFAEGAAETTAVKLERIRIAGDEAKEQIGTALLPTVQKLSDFVLNSVVPNLTSFINGLSGQGSLTEASGNATSGAFKFGEQIKKVLKTVVSFKNELIILAGVIATVFVVSKISAAVVTTIALINTLIRAYNLLKASAIVAGVATAFALNPLLGVGAVALAAGVLAGANALAGRSNTKEAQGPSTGSIPFASGFAPPTIIVPKVIVPNVVPGGGGGGGGGGGRGVSTASRSAVAAAARVEGVFDPSAFRRADEASMRPIINLNVTGAIDPEGTARTIVDNLNNSFYRGGGGGANSLVAL